MLFNSFEFIIFLPLVFIFYWFFFNRGIKTQNLFVLVVSYIFYGWWDWRFLSLIAFSSLIDFIVAINIEKTSSQKTKKIFLTLSLITNLGFLVFFKYYNFFVESLSIALEQIGISIDTFTLNIVLPVGISFYTFQTISYTIDVYRKRLKPTKNIINFFAFVSFFPQLVAGPIERATNLLPQFEKKRFFSYQYASEGMRQILWGLFKKIVIADNCAKYVNQVFNNYEIYDGGSLIIAAILFAFQIYGDFSGYSDIAIGTSKLFGFRLMKNFNFPYFSRDISEFWRRWHISLSTWFKDYLYIPLGGSKNGKLKAIRNTFIIFTVSGFWHGANWTFIAWGIFNGIYYLPLLLANKNRKNIDIIAHNKFLPSLKEIISIIVTFFLTVLGWVFFRSNTLSDAFLFILNIFKRFEFSVPKIFPLKMFLFVFLLISIEWIQRQKEHGLDISDRPIIIRWLIYMVITFITILFNSPNKYDFIYFQF